MQKKVGLFFGTFNPIHVGHLIIANYLAEHSDLDEIWLVVTPHNPHKKKKTLLDDIHRLAMVRIAIEGYPKLQASNIEFDLPQPNYTVKTLAVLEEKYPDKEFCLIMGEDNLKSLHKWKNYEVILERFAIYVYPRVSVETTKIQFSNHNNITKVNAPIVEISSTFIRKNIASGNNIRPMLPKNVWEYLDEMNFYK
ncbi:MAG: nicotinate-nucleotide adenylyltransferase [Flavobacteriaceae bacterium]|nr:nicotinate-nucleotide adenylyltransferase [Flavobacteriaceae bacterium]